MPGRLLRWRGLMPYWVKWPARRTLFRRKTTQQSAVSNKIGARRLSIVREQDSTSVRNSAVGVHLITPFFDVTSCLIFGVHNGVAEKHGAGGRAGVEVGGKAAGNG